MTDDLCDYTALERMWPSMKYGDPWPFAWFNRVGRTRQQREGIKALRVRRGPRGLTVLLSGAIHTRSTISGEFESK